MTERTPAQLAAFERARAARQAALERKRKGKEPPPPAPTPPVEAPIVEAPQEEPPVPEEPPVQVEPPPPVEQAPQPFEELEFVDADELLAPLTQLIQQQSETMESLRGEVQALKTHQADLANSFVDHGIKTTAAINFV